MTKTKEECLNKLHSFMKEPNRKFSTYRLTISVADYAQPEKWNPNLSVQH